jgi:hypothetical protein
MASWRLDIAPLRSLRGPASPRRTLVFRRTGALSKRLPKREAPDLNVTSIRLIWTTPMGRGRVEIDLAKLSRKGKRINITPARLLTIIDQAAAQEGGSRWRSAGTEAP